MCVLSHFRHVWHFVTPWTIAPGFPLHGVSQSRILEWVAISFSRGSSQPRDPTCASCIGRWILYHWATREAHIHRFNKLKTEFSGYLGSWQPLPAKYLVKDCAPDACMWRDSLCISLLSSGHPTYSDSTIAPLLISSVVTCFSPAPGLFIPWESLLVSQGPLGSASLLRTSCVPVCLESLYYGWVC